MIRQQLRSQVWFDALLHIILPMRIYSCNYHRCCCNPPKCSFYNILQQQTMTTIESLNSIVPRITQSSFSSNVRSPSFYRTQRAGADAATKPTQGKHCRNHIPFCTFVLLLIISPSQLTDPLIPSLLRNTADGGHNFSGHWGDSPPISLVHPVCASTLYHLSLHIHKKWT